MARAATTGRLSRGGAVNGERPLTGGAPDIGQDVERKSSPSNKCHVDFGTCPHGHRFTSRNEKIGHAGVNMPQLKGEGAERIPRHVRYRQREWRRSA
jgi:hypothetical protein